MVKDSDNNSSKKPRYLDGLAYEPMGMPTKRVLRLQAENQKLSPKQPQIIRHKELPVHTLVPTSKAQTQNTAYLQHKQNLKPVHPEHNNPYVQSTQGSDSIQNIRLDKSQYSRQRMVNEQLIARGIRDENVLRAMQSIPRHLFVSEALQATAYDDRPLPIAEGQTISQPYVVAFMCQLLLAERGMRVLEIGTGSGYQAAVLHEMGLRVFSVERLKSLYQMTTPLLKEQLAYKNMTLTLSDGTLGWKNYAPYDRIIVAAGGNKVPEDLKEQLSSDGGIMVIPIGAERQKQRIIRVFKINGKCIEEDCGPVSFVDLVGARGWN